MKRSIGPVLLIVFQLGCYSIIPKRYRSYEKAGPIILSEEVGGTIDPEERKKYDLLQGIKDFKSAEFYSIKDGGYLIEIETETLNLLAINRDSMAVEILRDYIANNEEIKNSRKGFERRWRIVDYDDLGQPITQYEIDRTEQKVFASGYACGCFSVGFLPVVILSLMAGGFNIFTNDMPRPWAFLMVLIIGNFLTTKIGVMIGHKKDIDNALRGINQARRPKVVRN